MTGLGRLYRFLYLIKEKLEYFHLVIVIFEVLLLVYGLKRVFKDSREIDMHGVGDMVLFLVLCMFLIADLAVRFRKIWRGYHFAGWLVTLGLGGALPFDEERLLDRLRALRGRGLHGRSIEPGEIPTFGAKATEAIANESSSVFSIRTLGTTDEEWAHAEAGYLNGWLSRFPWAVRWVPSSEEDSPHGYFSVIVPIREESYRMIRNGHLNTVLAHLDAEAVAFAAAPRGGPYKKRLRLLAYAQVLVRKPHSRAREPEDLSMLFFCSLEHLAFLLRGFHARNTNKRIPWNLSIICEASGKAQTDALQLLGFSPIRGSGRDGGPRKSPAGFTLCELDLVPGKASEGGPPGDRLARFIEAAGGPL